MPQRTGNPPRKGEMFHHPGGCRKTRTHCRAPCRGVHCAPGGKAFCFFRFPANSQCLPAGRHMGLPLRQIGEMVRNIPEKRREWPWPFRPTDAGSATISQSYNTVPHAVGAHSVRPAGKRSVFSLCGEFAVPTSGQAHGSAPTAKWRDGAEYSREAERMALTVPLK